MSSYFYDNFSGKNQCLIIVYQLNNIGLSKKALSVLFGSIFEKLASFLFGQLIYYLLLLLFSYGGRKFEILEIYLRCAQISKILDVVNNRKTTFNCCLTRIEMRRFYVYLKYNEL